MNTTKNELVEILSNHCKWLSSDEGGIRANLSGADLRGADLYGANLSGANLSYADLSDANLSYANLRGADLSGADLRGADLSYANLSDANLSGANLSYANLSDANLSYANLSDADLSDANLRGATGCAGERVQCIQISPYIIIILDRAIVWGGCTKKTAKEWLEYDGEELSDSDKKYLETVTKPFIRMVCAL